MYENDDSPRTIVSYLTLRKAIGVLGILLPILLLVGGLAIGDPRGRQPSISDYYATGMPGDIFVGVLFVIGLFLFSYRGYERKDDVAGDLACVCAVGVALFSTKSDAGWVRVVHYASAASLFLILAYFSLRLFTKTREGETPTPGKLTRNKVYKACGWTMLACLALIPLYNVFLDGTRLASLYPVFWLETFALWAFGVSWAVKGRMLWRDAAVGTPDDTASATTGGIRLFQRMRNSDV